ncbi:LEA_2 domain-containing protein [Cephalotus follicularis]|uniref:LEA_2 domain-containing protein n=1 Tax=Cephalotus follicularis TaxID=3775 RepID=A0A1Q3CF57_CEPFO|nr:LEA_2 domain-containing protein [Cephalotus follicularis]
MHAKTDSEGTSVDASWPPRSPPRRPLYYVQSPSNHDVEKMSYGSSPSGSPTHHYYHCSPIHHSRESSTSRFSASLKNPRSLSAWKHVQIGHHDGGRDHDGDDDRDEMDGDSYGGARNVRLYFCGLLIFIGLFTLFSLILWGASKGYKPKILVENIVFENFNVQAGSDQSGVQTDMLSLNSTVQILYRNPATFFAVHVTATPLKLHYYQLKIASGQMKKFTQSRKRQRTVVTVVQGYQVPLYGGVSVLSGAEKQLEKVALPLNLTFVVRSRAYILGRLVKSKFCSHIRCYVTLRGKKLGQSVKLSDACFYQ